MSQALYKLFVQRLIEEMDGRGLTKNDIASRAKSLALPLSQPSVSRILSGKQDPSLEKVDAFATILGVPSWYLLTDKAQVEHRVISPPQNVVRLQQPYPSIFSRRPAESAAKKRKRR